MEVKEPDTESDSDEEEDEYEQTSERQLELRRMETALAQVVVSMETANTHTSRGAMGIVANYSGRNNIDKEHGNPFEPYPSLTNA
ncbi:hypothetical protein L916_19953, partial [Phytophthora nicotianae]